MTTKLKITLESDVDTLDHQGPRYSAVHFYDVPDKDWQTILQLVCSVVPVEKRSYVPS